MSGQIWVSPSAFIGHIASFSPDGSRLATASDDNIVRVWDAENGKLILAPTGHSAGLNSISYSPDGRHIATTSEDKTVLRVGCANRTRTPHSDRAFK